MPTISYRLIILMFGLITEVIKGGCTASCEGTFKMCMSARKSEGCSRAYYFCKNIAQARGFLGGCTKTCKNTKKMSALKSSC